MPWEAILSGVCLWCGGLAATVVAAESGDTARFPREHVYDTAVHADEALVNVRLTNSRWPDCTTLESTVSDIFRIEGVTDKCDQDKALALWKWMRILMSASGYGYPLEGPAGKERVCQEPHKLLTVYGHHQCDGLSWTMAPLWRAAGYMALDECTPGHTTAALRYRDADGQLRYHSFDPKRNYIHWDEKNQRVATRSQPVMRGMVYRHVTTPASLHSLRTSLRLGETVVRKWENEGHVVVYRVDAGGGETPGDRQFYYEYLPGKTGGVYTVAGEEVQTYVPENNRERFARDLYEGSQNAACSSFPAPGEALLHPKEPGRVAEFIYRLAPPYVVVDAHCEVTLHKGAAADTCRLLVSRDGNEWTPLYTQVAVGTQKVAVDFGKEAASKNLPNVYTAYGFFVKVELQTADDVRRVGFDDLKIVVHRELNKRALPNLRPGQNVLWLNADRIAEGWGLDLKIDYRVDGVPCTAMRRTNRFPYLFKVNVPGVPEDIRADYDEHFNEGRVQMSAISMQLVPTAPGDVRSGVVAGIEVPAEFADACPFPADLKRTISEPPETDLRQSSGFFPQSDEVLNGDATMKVLIHELHGPSTVRRWLAAEDLGAYPKAADELLAVLPKADSDLTLFLCKALGRIKDKRALPLLLEKWDRAPAGAPGARYIPDVLAAIGDRSVVPRLVAPLEKLRFDFRFHIAHALGILGGAEAEKALKDLAANDLFPPVREEARAALERLRAAR